MYNDVPAVVHGPALGRLGRVPPAPVSLSPRLGGGAGRGGGLRGLTGRAETKAKSLKICSKGGIKKYRTIGNIKKIMRDIYCYGKVKKMKNFTQDK